MPAKSDSDEILCLQLLRKTLMCTLQLSQGKSIDHFCINPIIWIGLIHKSSLQCYSVLSDILVKNELCIPLERGLNVLSTGKGFICISHPSKL